MPLMTRRSSVRQAKGWIPTRSATPSTALVPQRKVGFPIPNAGLLLGFQGTKTARREGISSPFSDAGGCTSPQNSGGFQPHRGHVDIVGERMADDFRLLVDLLGHEMPVIPFLGEQASGGAALDPPLNWLAGRVADVGAFATDDDPVALLEIGHAIGERRESQRIGAEIHFAVAIANGAPPWPRVRSRSRLERAFAAPRKSAGGRPSLWPGHAVRLMIVPCCLPRTCRHDDRLPRRCGGARHRLRPPADRSDASRERARAFVPRSRCGWAFGAVCRLF